MGKTCCKVCGNEADHVVYKGSFGIEEEHITCACGYNYMFSYGIYEEQYPGEPLMGWSHSNHEKVVVGD